VVAKVAGTVEPLLRQKDQRLAISVEEGLTVTADPLKLKQMILNLVSNSIKFTPNGGRITINASLTGTSVEISVADTGIGIAASDVAGLFTEFHQLASRPGVLNQGAGLGLALTQRFAALHGGVVRVESRIHLGSKFTIVLPVAGPPANVAMIKGALVTPDEPDPTLPLILVVEDDRAAAELMQLQLQGAGFRTRVARTGADAVSQARTLKPSAITLDILLPDMDGWEVMALLKGDPQTSSIPIVVVSVVDNPELGLALGALDYLAKPVVADELVRRLGQLIPSPEAGQGRPILIVDDDPANRNWLRRALKPVGFEVLIASGGGEAIRLARSRHPAMVLLDLLMPDISGFDVIEALHADPTTRGIPIVVLTTAQLNEADRHRLSERVSAILRRGSIGASDLIALLRQTIGQPAGVR
jgi:CheY-like chemotaxis protein